MEHKTIITTGVAISMALSLWIEYTIYYHCKFLLKNKSKIDINFLNEINNNNEKIKIIEISKTGYKQLTDEFEGNFFKK